MERKTQGMLSKTPNRKEKDAWSVVLRVLFSLMIVTVVAFVIYDHGLGKKPRQVDHNCVLLTEWEWVREDGSTQKITVPTTLPAKTGESVTIRTVLPTDLGDDQWLEFSNSRNLIVKVDGEVRKTFDESDCVYPGGFVKNLLMFVRLSSADAGKVIEVTKYKAGEQNGILNEFRLGDSLGIVAYYLNRDAIKTIAILVLLILSFAIAVIGIGLRVLTGKHASVFYMGISVFFAASWLLFDSEIYQFVADNYYVDGILSYLMIMLLPFPVLFYTDHIQRHRYHKPIMILSGISLMEYAGFFLLHLTGIADFSDNLIWINLAIAMHIVAVIVMIILDVKHGNVSEYPLFAVGFILFSLLSLMEIIAINFIQIRVDGSFFLIGLYVILGFSAAQWITDIVEYRRDRARAIEANSAKSEFLAKMSHEIRTPIHSILGMNEMILREGTGEDVLRYAKQIENSGKDLLDIVNTILDLSKVEAGKLEIVRAPFSTEDLAAGVFVSLDSLAAKKELRVKKHIDEQMPKKLVGDALRIRQIIVNLISNAVKYTEKGEVRLFLEVLPTELAAYCTLKITVEDTGIGMSEAEQQSAFQSFERAGNGKVNSIEGTGLGLAIVKSLTEAMDGTIRLNSEPGVGSTLIVTLPLKIADPTPLGNWEERRALSENEDPKQGLFRAPQANVLLVDDNNVNLMIAKELLKRTEVQVELAHGGDEALEMTARKKYDLIFLDYMMPDPDGIAVLQTIRKDSKHLNLQTPIVAMTANAITGARERFLGEGFDDYISKPIDARLLEKMMVELLPASLVCYSSGPKKSADASVRKDSGMIADIGVGLEDPLYIDLKQGLHYCQQSTELYNEIVLTYLAEDKRGKLTEAFVTEDWHAYCVTIHALKSASRTIGAIKLAEEALRLEEATDEESMDIEYVQNNHRRVYNEYVRLIELLTARKEKLYET